MRKKLEGEKRIYAIVAASIEGKNGKVVQPLGRQVAQVAHVVSKLRFQEAAKPIREEEQLTYRLFEPITTIVLQARDGAELWHVLGLLCKKKILVTSFFDINPEYGPGNFMTAICTHPVFKSQVEGILDYLPLWGSK